MTGLHSDKYIPAMLGIGICALQVIYENKEDQMPNIGTSYVVHRVWVVLKRVCSMCTRDKGEVCVGEIVDGLGWLMNESVDYFL